ncbi:PREDICTED: uncharacterized protein LOC109580921 [Amphimedon queenslandica]|uniref:ORC1/DEAH AAA+ ATPase domain-containing protein n=1 Tax=Amphimedon queenslandica TaxID=400682 RepID=A0A1X7V898_AMPQE|nr:PREDICTED: uncharacterized protein LOC109580921 [Amphimedon queenslandica]|eukprot:XP_019850066.1 PREDICTED: uncharacterized protein LOC109580921 [Amphimedon queenslandica]
MSSIYCYLRHSNRCSVFKFCRSLHRSPVLYETPPITPPPTRNPFKRIARYFRNDPFARVSVIFGGTVLTVLLIIEAFIPKEAKKVKPQVAILPPSVSHPTIARENELSSLLASVPTLVSTKPSVVIVTGLVGSGKTELTNQFVSKFVEVSLPRFSKKESSKPIVIHLDASGTRSLGDSARYAVGSLGVTSSESGDSLSSHLSSLLRKLGEQKARWLLIIDGVNSETAPLIRELISSSTSNGRTHRKGYLLVTARSGEVSGLFSGHQKTISLEKGLTETQTEELFYKLSASEQKYPKEQVQDLTSNLLRSNPYLISLAALTLRMYEYFCSHHEGEIRDNLLSQYIDMIKSCDNHVTGHDDHMTGNVTRLYIGALSSCDNYFLHSIDFLSLCDLDRPVPISLIKEHLNNPFYRLPLTPGSASILEDTPTAPPISPPSQSYLSAVKDKLTQMTGWPPPSPPPLPPSQALPDPLTSLRLSPFVHAHTHYGVELLSFSPGLKDHVDNHFLAYTAPKIEKEHLLTEEQRWNESAWFKRFRSFDSQSSLSSFHRSLPGLESSSVQAEKEWGNKPPPSPHVKSYSDYIHNISHNHRFLSALRSELKYLSRDPSDIALRRYLRPHLVLLSSNEGVLSKRDCLWTEASLLSIDSALSSDKTLYINKYNDLVQKMKEVFGSKDYAIASALTSLAELHYYNGHYKKAEELLLTAVGMYESSSLNRSPLSSLSSSSFPTSSFTPSSLSFSDSMDYAFSLATLGLVLASLEEREKCRDTLEKALGLFQTLPSNGEVPKKQRRLVATTVTDLGHAYISTGDLISAKRYLDLASVAQRGIHGDDHPEVVRTLNVLSIVHVLLGDDEKSRELRREAGKIQQRLQQISDIA